MYRTGWGFQAQLQDVAVAALIWQSALRPLRLVRQRHLTRLKNGLDVVNLASLPLELLEIIEDHIAAGTYYQSAALADIDAECPCAEFYEGLYSWTPFEEAENEFIDVNSGNIAAGYLSDEDTLYSSSFDELIIEEASEAFRETETYDALFDEYFEIHQSHGCEAVDGKGHAWDLILSRDRDVPDQSKHKKQVLRILDALDLFEQDFGLLRICPRYDPVVMSEDSTASLFLVARSQTVRRKPGANRMIELPNISTTQFTRFVKVFFSSPYSSFYRVAPNGLTWITANMDDEEFGEIEVDCKCRKSVEEHNSAIELTRKKTAEKRGKRSKKKVEKEPNGEDLDQMA